MKLLFTFLCYVALLPAFGQSARERSVLDTERQRFDAQISRDYDALDRLLADDLVYTHSSGKTDGKAAYIQSIRDGVFRYEKMDIEEQAVRFYGNVAIINGVCRIKATNNGQPVDFKVRYTDAYVKQKGRWQLVTWQSLRLTP